MFLNQVFAVVDLETTGTQRNEHDRIIQFGCALIKNGHIFKTFSFLINPQKRIPPVIENLTGITNKSVKNQPPFAYFAAQISKILKNTIFVAHNVNFDLPFLNYELVNAGLEPLTNRSLDTVELAQIAFPTFASFKLQDLTKRLKIRHTNPHQADSDAVVTAKLLLKILAVIEEMPQATLNQLMGLSKGLTRDNDYVFEEIANTSRLSKRPLPKNMIQIKGLVLQKQSHALPDQNAPRLTFPLADSDKKKMFKGNINYRRGQVNLINRIHNFVSAKNDKSLLVEAPNGTGKTFSYLFSYAYNLSNLQKLVVATPTMVLQQQIVEQEIPQLNQVTGLPIKAELIKSPSHYLDLDGFFQTLYDFNQNKPTTILQMRIISWLTQTTTGDLDELQLTTYNAPIFSLIKHPGDARVGTDFSDVDFWNYARYRQEQADILVTNHAFLANHGHDSIWGQNPFLVIDEAHRFEDNVVSARSNSLQFESFWGLLSHLHHVLYNSHQSLADSFNNSQDLLFLLSGLEPKITELIHTINEVQRLYYSVGNPREHPYQRRRNQIEIVLSGDEIVPIQKELRRVLERMQARIDEVRQGTNKIVDWLLAQKDSLLMSDIATIDDLTSQLDYLDSYSESAYILSDQLLDAQTLGEKGFLLQITDPNDPLSTNVTWLTLDTSDDLHDIYQRFTHKLFVSATLTKNDQDFTFMVKQLGLDPTQVETYQAKLTLDYKKHLKIASLKDGSVAGNPNEPNFERYLEQQLPHLASVKAHTLILFTNLEVIKNTYERIANNPLLKDYEVLAQGITGSNEKIAKRFALSKKAILLGANTFWEGIDFRDTVVDVVIITRLPFESPDQPAVQLRQQKLVKQGFDVFTEDVLPRAIIRFRQAAGRLIRHERDYGVFIVLDQRFNQSGYSTAFKQSLPVKQIEYLQKDDLVQFLKHEK